MKKLNIKKLSRWCALIIISIMAYFGYQAINRIDIQSLPDVPLTESITPKGKKIFYFELLPYSRGFPAYNITIYENLVVEYSGRSYVKVLDKAYYRISKQNLQAIFKGLEAYDFDGHHSVLSRLNAGGLINRLTFDLQAATVTVFGRFTDRSIYFSFGAKWGVFLDNDEKYDKLREVVEYYSGVLPYRCLEHHNSFHFTGCPQ